MSNVYRRIVQKYCRQLFRRIGELVYIDCMSEVAIRYCLQRDGNDLTSQWLFSIIFYFNHDIWLLRESNMHIVINL